MLPPSGWPARCQPPIAAVPQVTGHGGPKRDGAGSGPDTVGPARGSRGEERPSVKGEPRQREPCRPWELGTSHNPPVKAKPARIRAAIRRPEPSRLEMSHPGGRSTPGVASDPAVQGDSRRFVRCGRPDQACRGRRHALGIHERQLSQGQSGLARASMVMALPLVASTGQAACAPCAYLCMAATHGNARTCRCDTRSHLARGLADWRADYVGRVVPGACSRPGPALSCAAGNGGVRSTGESPRVSRPIREATGQGQTGRVNRVNPR
jgi:hypothetical protein